MEKLLNFEDGQVAKLKKLASSERVDITVVVCTYNRAATLEKALESIADSLMSPSVTWEVLVVDNNSSDETSQVVEKFCGAFPGRFRYLFEAKQGLSAARNAGIQDAHADIIAFTDDDVAVEPTWLQNLVEPLLSKTYAASGGRIFPKWSSAPPAWLPIHARYGLAPLTVFDLGTTALDLTEPPVGANMAFRKSLFATYGDFRTDLGRRPGTLIGDEEIDFGNRLLGGGELLRYVPSAVVHHPVQENRLTKEYFLSWWFDKGRADIMLDGVPKTRWRVRGVPLFFLRRLAAWTARWMFAVTPAQRFSNKIKTWSLAGMIVQCYSQSAEINHGTSRECEQE
ncbi:MAG TPA: glycosyltransferase [Terriglobales bacterium]|jgi:glycosyltransferase involved in cell wall biosynthesis|nr:glycosyltransferase [Terriglobales bacterium]